MWSLGVTDKKLWRLALPMILSNITIPLLGLVDTIVIGHLDSEVYLSGVAIGTTITSFLFMLLLFLRMSTTGITAQAWGAQQPARLITALIQPLSLALPVGIAVILLRYPMIHFALSLTGGDSEVLQQAEQFLAIRWWSAPATFINLVILGWLIGVQYARAPLILLIVGNSVNIILELLMVLQWHWGVKGAAAATVIAEYMTLVVGLLLINRFLKQQQITFTVLPELWRQGLGRLLKLNREILIRSLLIQSCFATMTLVSARLGEHIVAVNALLMMFVTFTAYALDGFAYAVESISGEAVGSQDTGYLQQIWRSACRQAGLVALLFSISYALMGPQIIHLLTSLPTLRSQANHYLWWQVICPLLGVWCYLLDGLFVGATRAREMRNSMAIATLSFMLTLVTIPWLGNHGLWLALIVFMAVRGLTLGHRWRIHRRNGSWFQGTEPS